MAETVSDPEAIAGTIIPVDLTAPPSNQEAAAFLLAASFGPTVSSISELVSKGYSEWFLSQQSIDITYMLPSINPIFLDKTNPKWEGPARREWYNNAIYGEDQLRQRAAFTLSQIFTVSTGPRNWMFKSHLHARYMDIIQENALGNFRDLMEEVTYSPLMGEWLTYIGNEKADEVTGSEPDENYAREIMQLFTIGLVELGNDGHPILNDAGETIETYTLDDISGLSKVFTGLWWADKAFGENATRIADKDSDTQRMVMHDDYHSTEEKSFLGYTIPAGTTGDESIKQALDVLFNHPNVGPFIGKQLIQRLTTSNPSSAYVERVANVFNSGTHTLPNGTVVGTGERGDLLPVWAAILFDKEAHNPNRFNIKGWGKVREPIIRFVHWARAANVNAVKVTGIGVLKNGAPIKTIGQDPFRSNSVFNFYRPGFVAGGTSTAQEGLVAPELQITTSATSMHYPNFMQAFILRDRFRRPWTAGYNDQRSLARDPDALTEHLNLVMTGGRMTDRTRERISETIASVSVSGTYRARQWALRRRAQIGMLLVVNTQEYNTQQ